MTISTVTWTKQMSVGVSALDADHQRLIDLLNVIFTACFAGVGDDYVSKTLDDLIQYTQEHFKREIDLLSAHGFPDCEDHAREHERLVTQLQEKCETARSQLAKGISVEVMEFLRGWLVNHIMERDMVYAAYLKETGVSK